MAQFVPQAARVLTAGLQKLHCSVISSIAEHCCRSDLARLSGAWGHQLQQVAHEQVGLPCRSCSTSHQQVHYSNTSWRSGRQLRSDDASNHAWSWRFSNIRHGKRLPQAAAKYSSLGLQTLSDPEEHSSASQPAYLLHTDQPRHTQSAARARVLDGRTVAAAWSAELEQQVPSLVAALGRPPGLAVILVGSRPDSMLYVSRKEDACRNLGIRCQVLHLPDSISQSELQEAVGQVAADEAVDGVLVQLPLPRHLDEERVMEFLDPRKDVDGFHPLNMGRMLMRGRARRFVPATPLGVVELLSRSGVSLSGKTAVVLGDSNIVGTPLAALLRDEGAALVTTCHRVSYQEWYDQTSSRSRRAQAEVCLPRLPGPAPAAEKHRQQADSRAAGGHSSRGAEAASSRFQASQLPNICCTADILIVAVGSPELVKADWVKPGAIVVDVGINVVPLTEPNSSSMVMPAEQQQHHWQHQHSSLRTDSSQCCHPHSSLQLAQGSLSESRCDTAVLGTIGSSYDMCSGSYRVVGDVAHEEVAGIASIVTPVPGGVGPMTIAAVLHNTLQAARYTAKLLPW